MPSRTVSSNQSLWPPIRLRSPIDGQGAEKYEIRDPQKMPAKNILMNNAGAMRENESQRLAIKPR